MNKLAVIIPCYKKADELLPHETLSINNTIQKLKLIAPIYIVGPKGLNIQAYKNLYSYSFSFIGFDSRFFSSIYSYNLLLKDIKFYQEFSNFEYILIVQTDAFIFNPDYTEFFDAVLDYVGSPWFTNPIDHSDNRIHVGNGGYSLRKSSSCIKVLKSNKPMLTLKETLRLVKESEFHSGKFFLLQFFYTLWYYFFQNNFSSGRNTMPIIYEDVFWSIVVPSVFKNFNVATPEMATRFGFETYPSKIFELNGYKLPTGCHGFHKYEPEFWRKYIPLDRALKSIID